MLFLILAWRKWLLRVSQIFFLSSSPGVLGYGSVCHEPLPITDLLIIYFRWREGVPTSVLGSQPIIWLLSSFPLVRRFFLGLLDVTQVRLLSTNLCWYPLCDLHSFLTVWRLATVHSNGRLVLILFLSSPWDITWQYQLYRIWFGWVLWHINHWRLFNVKFSLYMNIKYIWFGWVRFYGISIIVGYLMPNPLYTYISNI